MTFSSKPQTQNDPNLAPLRVMVVDDSLVIRGLISRVLKQDSSIEIVASVPNGEKAVERVKQGGVDLVVLDIEMPVMDGLTALPLLLKAQPNLIVIMASTLTTRNAGVSLQALNAGATDYIPKPTTNKDLFSAEDFHRELLRKVHALGAGVRRRQGEPARTSVAASKSVTSTSASSIQLRPASLVRPRILAIASSTGGPVALQDTLRQIGPNLPVPIVITQHMPPTFTDLLAKNLTKETGVQCAEAKVGDVLQPGQAFIAPGDYHMCLVKDGANVKVALNQGPQENFCRPAADPMLRSLVDVYGSAILTVVLTGMGSDGEKGCQSVVNAGGAVVAQDEATSVVWGMPAAVARGGLCHAVVPISQMGAKVKSILRV